MNLIQLKYFCAVSESATVSEAAKKLHVSQPSVSAAVKELENEFGILFFNRHHNGVRLTEEGYKFHALAKDLLERSQSMYDYMSVLGNEKREIKLGIPPMIGSLFLPEIFGNFLNDNKDIQIRITENGRNVLIDNILNNIIDIAFLPHDCEFDDRFSVVHITGLEVVCCVSTASPLAKKDKIDFHTLGDYPLVLFENSFFQTEKIMGKFKDAGVHPNILLQTGQLSTMISVIENNLAVGFAFRELIEKSSELLCVQLDKPLYVDVSLVRKKDKYSFFAMDKLTEFIKSRASHFFEI